MTRNAALALAVVSLIITHGIAAAAQNSARMAGTWDVHIEHFTGRIVDEQWIVTQNGNKVTGKVVVNTREFPLEGTIDGNKINFKVTVRPADPNGGENSAERANIFLGTVDGDSIKGEIKKLNDDGTFTAKRARS